MSDEAARETVRVLLAMAELHPSEDEIDVLAESYERNRQLVSMVHAVPGVRYAEPAVRFEPRVTQ